MRNFPKFIFSLNFLYIILIAAETAAIIFLCLYLPAFLPVAAVFAVVWLITFICVLVVVCKGGSSEINCAIILLITALPVAGAVIYAFSRLNGRECGTLTVAYPSPQSGFGGAAHDFCGTGAVSYDSAEYFENGEKYFTRLFKVIEKAQKYVYLEYFIVCRGAILSRLISALRAARSNGAEIKIIIDGIGSAFKTGRRELKLLKSVGAEVKIFHRLTPLIRSRLNFRDHRKIAVIDGKAAFTGGINIADEYANIASPYGYWKDTGVAVYGAAAEVFAGMFLSVWQRSYKMDAPERDGKKCIPFYDSPPARAGFCEDAYAAAIYSARERVHIFTPYFCTGEKINSALAFAAKRGVDVRIIIPHIPDKKYAFELSKASALPLAAAGVKFFEYTPGFMHAKSLICDDKLFIGSYNFDFRSMRLNYECGIVFDGKMCALAERDFWECLRLSAPLAEGKIGVLRRAFRGILKLFAPLM